MKTSKQVMIWAHILDRNKPGFAWSDILRYAWYFAHFRQWLKQGIVTFSFFKKDGSIREAKGTLYHLFIPNDKLPKGLRTQSNYRIISYFDLDKQDWRSFDICEFIGFVNYYRITPSNFLPDKEAKRKKVDKKEKYNCFTLLQFDKMKK